MHLDIAATTQPKSDQQNFDDYAGGPKTVTVEKAKVFDRPDQPVELHLVEYPGRPYKPSKSMRRVLLACWGNDPAAYAGRELTLYGDPTVKFGGKEVGGIKISHMSHMPAAKSVQLTVSRGHREQYVVQPIVFAAPDGWQDDVAACDSIGDLNEFFEMAREAGWWNAEVAAACTARKAELSG